MLYFSLLLIFSGAVLLIYAVIAGMSEKKVGGTQIPSSSSEGYPSRPVRTFQEEGRGEVRTVSGEELIADDAVSSSPSEELLDFGVSEEEVLTVDEPVFEGEFEDESEEDIVTESQSVNSARAVFYEDSSQLIDYSSEKGIIDPDFDHYREIKRIDEGSLVLEKEGLTFYCGKKLFRFDFIKAEKIYFSRNSIAVVYRTGSPVRLFLLPNETVLADIAREAYKEFLESRSAKK